MDVTAVTESVNKKQTNSGVKRSYSTTNTLNNTFKYVKRTQNQMITSVMNKINVRDYFSQERPFANLKIKINEEIIWCDKALLAAASPVLFEQLLKLKSNEDLLTFDDIRIDDFFLLLEFIYPSFNPEINEENVSSLLQLSHRFQFEVLKHACRFYVMKYLSTIRNVFNKCSTMENKEDCFAINANDVDNTNKKEIYRRYDLIEFRNGTCIDAYDIVLKLCQWLQAYFSEDNRIISQSIMSILQQISTHNLNRAMDFIDMDDNIKTQIYKERAQYLEKMY